MLRRRGTERDICFLDQAPRGGVPLCARARDYFETARQASRDMASVRQQLEVIHRTVQAPASVQHEGRLKARIERDSDVIDRATRVLYGDEYGRGGLSEVSPQGADVLWWRYCHDAAWKQISSVMGVSVTSCHTWLNEALSMIDECGLLETD